MNNNLTHLSLFSFLLISATVYSSNANALLVDNLNGTITDTDLGLMWLQTPGDDLEFGDANNWAENLIFAGFDNWRLPSALNFTSSTPDTAPLSTNNEFGHLYGDELDNPTGVADILPFIGYMDLFFWTGTEDASNSSNAFAFLWSFDFAWQNQTHDKERFFHVTAVRDIGITTPIPEPPTLILFALGLIYFYYLFNRPSNKLHNIKSKSSFVLPSLR